MGSTYEEVAAPHRAATAGDAPALARAYLSEVEAGRDPGLAAYVSSLPEPLREEVFRTIDRALANREPGGASDPVDDAAEIVVRNLARESAAGRPEGRVSVSLDENRWLRWSFALVPGEIRRHLLAELLLVLRRMRAENTSRQARIWAALRGLADGLAQHAPLSSPDEGAGEPPAAARRILLGGWTSWRTCGVALLAGKLAGNSWLLLGGLLLLMGAIGSLAYVTLKLKGPQPERCVRYTNAVMGGTVVILGITLVYGLVTVGLLALAASLSAGWLASLALELQVFVVAVGACAVTLPGWVPEPWSPRRLLRV